MSFLRTTATGAWPVMFLILLVMFLILLGFFLTRDNGSTIVPTDIKGPEVIEPLPPVAPGAQVNVGIEVSASASVSYQWKTDGRGEIISDQTRSAITWQAPQEPGFYSVFVKVTINGVETEKSVAIEVIDTPIAAVSSSPTPTQTPSPAPPTDTPIPTETPIPPTDTPTSTPSPTNTPLPPTPTFTPIPPDTPIPTLIPPTFTPAPPTNTPTSATPISCLNAKITSPAGTDQEGEVGSFHVSKPVTISWEPASCNLVIQYYQLGRCYAVGSSDGCIPGQPAVASGVQVEIPPGVTEIKIWHAGQVTDYTWVSVK
jgi:hypothetical protein